MTADAATAPEPMWYRTKGEELLGPVTESGLTQVTCLVRRPDGQVIQLSELLNLILATAEGDQTASELARRVSAAYGRELSSEGLDLLINAKLKPLGLITANQAGAAGPSPATPLPKADALLALRVRGTLLPAPAVRRMAAVLSPLFNPVVVTAAVVGLAVLDFVLFVTADAIAALDQVIIRPVEFLLLYALLTTGAIIHELGHASACHHGGGHPGRIGASPTCSVASGPSSAASGPAPASTPESPSFCRLPAGS